MKTQFVDYFASSASFKSAYFNELAKYRLSNPLFEVNKRKDHVFVRDLSFEKEVEAGVKFRTAKAYGIKLVSQDW